MFNNVNTTNVVTNTNNDKRTSPGYCTIAENIAYLNTITHTSFSISTSFELWMSLDPGSILHPFHQCNEHSRNPRIGRTNGHSTCFVLWIKRDWYHSNSPSDSSLLIPRAFLGSEDCQLEQQSAHHDDHWRSHHQFLSIGGGHLHTDDSPFRPIHVCVRGLGSQNHTSERRIWAPVDRLRLGCNGWRWSSLTHGMDARQSSRSTDMI